MSRDLFDCSPAIARKIKRCNEIARAQARTPPTLYEMHFNWTDEDVEILARLKLTASGRYLRNLNA
jgi:hypothetical protein